MAPRRKVRAREAQLAFEALSIEGGLLSPEWLSKVALLEAGHQAAADYRVPKGLALRDEIGRFWRIAQAHWAEFKLGRAKQAEATQLAARFVEGLLREALGFNTLTATPPVVAGDRSYPIGRQALDGRVPVVVAPAGVGLDTLSPVFGDEGRRRSAFGLVQEYLNAEERALWGLCCDGPRLRLCRDNASLTRPAWVEADLERIFEEERYSDFAALWLLIHETRFGANGQPVSDCPLEAWRTAGRAEGTRAREKLRDGVEEALLALGKGFLAQPDNHPLRAALHGGKLTKDAFFQQLLRLVYRIIFLLTAEEREVLHPKDASAEGRSLYEEGYGLRRLRDRAAKRSAHDRFVDQWEALKITFRGVATGEPRLGLPALGGLFAADQCPDLDAAKLENRALLAAIFKLSWVREASGLARVNWRDMGPEELGSVYESLLELVPQIPEGERGFVFATGDQTKGNARKTTGSYYTPDSLVQVLLGSALDPVIQATVAEHPEDPVRALLLLTIVDPACGSGHFLLAAARRLAVQVARYEAKGTPSAEQYRHAVRQVVSRCIFGVDLNPMAVELCRVSLWMEALEPGRPLSFLDSHIQQGNALVGATPALMAKGIPDDAFEPIEGDDKKTASLLKKKNKAGAAGQRGLDSLWSMPSERESTLVQKAVAALEATPDSTLSDVAGKESKWDELRRSTAFTHQKFVADAWCASFVWPKPPTEAKQVAPLVAAAPTNELWRQIRDGQGTPPADTAFTVETLAGQYHFFHWHLCFPGVFSNGGFDVVLGNPPWEQIQLDPREYFSSRHQGIADANSAAARDEALRRLGSDGAALLSEYAAAQRLTEGLRSFLHNCGEYPLATRGRLNSAPLFLELALRLCRPSGHAGLLLPTGIATDSFTQYLFQDITESGRLRSLLGFENEEYIFPAVHHSFRFCLTTLGPQREPPFSARFVFGARQVEHIKDENRTFDAAPSDFRALNPQTRTCPVFRNRRDFTIAARVYSSHAILGEAEGQEDSGWRFTGSLMFMMNSDSHLFRERNDLEKEGHTLTGNVYARASGRWLPLYEAKMASHFDHRMGTYEGQTDAQANQGILPRVDLQGHQDPSQCSLPWFWVAETEVDRAWPDPGEWLLGWRKITRDVNERTLIAVAIPRAAVGDSLYVIGTPRSAIMRACLYANLCSFVMDYCARQKLGGSNLNLFLMKQLPVVSPDVLERRAPWHTMSSALWLAPRVAELTATADDMVSFGNDLGYGRRPFVWEEGRRDLLRAELDAAFFHLYGLSRDDADYILDTFPIVRKNDEKAHGEYRTKRVILEVYDAMAEAIRTGKPYQTRLDPPPADSRVAHSQRSGKR